MIKASAPMRIVSTFQESTLSLLQIESLSGSAKRNTVVIAIKPENGNNRYAVVSAVLSALYIECAYEILLLNMLNT